MPRQSMNTHASLSRAKRRTERRLLPAIWLETFPAAPLTFDSFSNSKGTRLRRWKSCHEGWPQSRVFTRMNGRFAHPNLGELGRFNAAAHAAQNATNGRHIAVVASPADRNRKEYLSRIRPRRVLTPIPSGF